MNTTDMYNTYSDVCFNYYFPISFNNRNREYIQMNEIPDVQWNCGDTITILFDIKDHNPNDYELVGSQFVVNFYNYRGEIIYSQCYDYGSYDPLQMWLVVWIDRETSELFAPGLYRCDIKMTNEESQTTLTLMTKDEFLIRVN